MKRKKMNTPAFLRHFLRRFRWGAEIPAFQKKFFSLILDSPVA